jgi:CMP-N-acetylneuraminic acid synthetase
MALEILQRPRTVGVIFARANNDRLPNKHLLTINSLPLILHSYYSVISQLDKVYIATNCPDIINLCGVVGISVIVRPDDLCQSDSPIHDSVVYVYKWLNSLEVPYERFVQLEGNTIYTHPNLITNCLDFFDPQYDKLATVVPCGVHHPNWSLSLDENLSYIESNRMPDRRVLPVLYHSDSTVVVRPSNKPPAFPAKVLCYPISFYDRLHIDTQDDLDTATKLLRK